MRLTIILIFLSTTLIIGQKFSLSGTIADSLTGEKLLNANIILTNLKNEKTYGVTSDKSGHFKINELLPSNYLLKISFVGYKSYTEEIIIVKNSIDLGTIKLSSESIETEVVKVIDLAIPVVVNEDTTEYNANAFTTNKDASAEDLVTKLPGVTIQDGKVQTQGENVNRILVDNKPFFGDDPNTVLKNIPAEVIDKIQVFDQMSEQSQFTGFDDGNTTKTINIVTRQNFRKGTFGKISAGYGNEEKYKTNGNINIFNEEQRISILGQINNNNEQNFSSEDLAGVMSSSSRRGGRMPGGGMRNTGGGFSGFPSFGGASSNFMIDAMNGLTETKAIGINYSDKFSSSFEITSSYFFNSTESNSVSDLEREIFLENDNTQNYLENNSSVSDNVNHRLNLRMNYQIDTLNSLLIIPRLSVQLNNGFNNNFAENFEADNLLSTIAGNYNSDYSVLSPNMFLLFRHRFLTKGRTLSLELNSSLSSSEGDDQLYSENTFQLSNSKSDTLDQSSEMIKKGFSGSYNIVYTEPLSENGIFQISNRLSFSRDRNDKKTYDKFFSDEQIEIINTELSNEYEKTYFTQSYGLGYRYQLRTFFLNLNVNYNISALENGQIYPYVSNTDRKFYSILPSFSLRYNFSKDENLRINYRGSNNSPSVEQLQNVVNNSNPLFLKTGNPSLIQDSRHFVVARYSKINTENMNSFFFLIGGTYTKDYIGNNSLFASNDTTIMGIILNKGTQLSFPENIDEYYNARGLITYGLPVGFLKSNLNFNLNLSFTNTPAKINNSVNQTKDLSYGLGMTLSSNISPDFDFTISSNSTFSDVKNSLQINNDYFYFNQNSRIKLFINMFEGFFLNSELTHLYDDGLGSEYNRNLFLWNLSFGKKFFEEKLDIRITAFDLFNENTNIKRNITDSYIEDVRTNTLGQYFLLTVTYNLRAF